LAFSCITSVPVPPLPVLLAPLPHLRAALAGPPRCLRLAWPHAASKGPP
jgi:hypothetical protein